jgi:general secretion pathway protein F/type IV pilus assembly protein PilC
MPSFAYTALDASGKQVTGSLSVTTRAEAYRKLESQRLTPVKVSEEAKAAAAKAEQKADEGPPPVMKRALLIHFTEELADLLDGGLQLEQALRVMEERQDSPIVRRVSKLVRDQVREGAMFSKALQNASPSFDDLYRNLVAAGEVSGSLPQILRRLSTSINQIHELQGRVTQAMIYPAFMVGALGILVAVLSTVLIPQLTNLMSKSGQRLPMGMQVLVAFSDFAAHWWWLIIVICTAAFLIFRGFIGTAQGRAWWDRAKLDAPLFGPVLSSRFYAQFCGSLGNLVNNGVPLLNGLKLSARATVNVFLKDLINKSSTIVGEGASLSYALRKVGYLPTLMLDMIAVGEQTGHLGKALEKVAQRYDKELDKRIKRMTAMITPVVLVIMAVIVGGVAYAVVTSIFQSMAGLRGRA